VHSIVSKFKLNPLADGFQGTRLALLRRGFTARRRPERLPFPGRGFQAVKQAAAVDKVDLAALAPQARPTGVGRMREPAQGRAGKNINCQNNKEQFIFFPKFGRFDCQGAGKVASRLNEQQVAGICTYSHPSRKGS
jgi:hypothetical protein